jgi:hypothetical protein
MPQLSNKMTETEAQQKVQKFWTQYRTMVIDRKRPIWREFYQKYRSYLDQKRKGGRESTLFIPRSFDSVETVVPRLLLAIYSVNPPFQMAPRNASSVEFANTLTEAYQYYSDVTNQYSTVAQTLRGVSIYGTGIIKSGWDNVLKRPTRYNVDISEFFKDPSAMEIEDCEYSGDVKVRSLSYLRKMEKNGTYKNIDVVEEKGEKFAQPSDLRTDNYMVQGLTNPNEVKRMIDADPQYQVVECWIDNGSYVITLAGGVLIRAEANPFPHQTFPYSPVKMIPDTTDFYGIGTLEPIRFLQDQVNDFNNATMDYIMRSVNQIMKVGVSEWENARTYLFKQGAMWKVNQMDGVQPLDMKPLPAEAFAITTQLNGYIDRTNSLTSYTRGSQEGSSESATGASLLAQAADSRLKLQLFYCQKYLQRMVELEAKCIQEWVPDNFVIRVTGHPYIKPINRADIQGEFDVFAAGISDLSTKETKRAQLTNLLNMILTTGAPQLLALQGKRLDMAQIFKQIFDTYEFKNSDTLMTDVPQAPVTPEAGGMQSPVGDMGIPASATEVLKSTAEGTAPMQLDPFSQGG